ncbi:DinB family protein [Roseisolibacter sp. H3M3-2]|uniref:DinB family protein n=1 Tax=Roseisolibacter sp. H3M3-2 TaxID=3031323 RepID=UPI0023DCC050|nr:DinB family protein [Roseisolibacter sp. H3M3-2]MDF1503073.1 DinB family protein [Roseisolibacter sp. H3M3-2]
MSTAVEPTAPAAVAISPEQLLAHWQGHRRLTRRLIAAFPEDQLFTFAIGGMRTFGQLSLELLAMAMPMVRGAATQEWETSFDRQPVPKDEILRQWDADTAAMDAYWAQIPAARFQETMTAFGQYTSPLYDLVLYCVDNEVHHRGQGYVYLRALGVEPPPFWERQ